MRKIPSRQKLEIVTRGAKQSLQISEVARMGTRQHICQVVSTKMSIPLGIDI
jgi:hypothetical protein